MNDEQERCYTAGQLAERLEGRILGDAELRITGVNALDDAAAEEVTFISDEAHARRWAESAASAAVVSESLGPAGHDPQRKALIFVPDAELASIALLELFQPKEVLPDIGVHPTAWVHETARLGAGVRVGPLVSIDRNAIIEDGVVLHAGVRLYAETIVGAGSVLHANCVIRQGCRIGRAVILHQNVSIGADGFGYRPAPDGRGLIKIPHIGTVILEDGVEIGANSCVDRAKFGATVVGAGTKIDNLVQIAHNCTIGRCCVIAGLAGLAGSAELGDGSQVGGAVSINDHVKVGSRVSIGGGSGVNRDIPDGEQWIGYPALPAKETLRIWARLRKLVSTKRNASNRR